MAPFFYSYLKLFIVIKTSVEKLANSIGFDIGTSDNVTQSELINGFSRGLSNSMDQNQLHTQICAIVDHLDPKAKNVIKELYEFVKLSEDEQS